MPARFKTIRKRKNQIRLDDSKVDLLTELVNEQIDEPMDLNIPENGPKKRGRGRPPKNHQETNNEEVQIGRTPLARGALIVENNLPRRSSRKKN